MVSTHEQSESFLTIGLEISDLGYRMRDSSKFNAQQYRTLGARLREAMVRQMLAPRRSQDEIAADIKKYTDERDTLAANRTPIIGPSMTEYEWLHDSDDSTGFWANMAEAGRLAKLKNMIDILNDELVRPE